MGRQYFGTDGVRGRVGESPITPEFVMRLGFAAGEGAGAPLRAAQGAHPAVLIGKDTRISAICSKPRSRPASRPPAWT